MFKALPKVVVPVPLSVKFFNTLVVPAVVASIFKVLLLVPVKLKDDVAEPLMVPAPLSAPAMLNVLPLSDKIAPD